MLTMHEGHYYNTRLEHSNRVSLAGSIGSSGVRNNRRSVPKSFLEPVLSRNPDVYRISHTGTNGIAPQVYHSKPYGVKALKIPPPKAIVNNVIYGRNATEPVLWC
jgi:hypothetical protein